MLHHLHTALNMLKCDFYVIPKKKKKKDFNNSINLKKELNKDDT